MADINSYNRKRIELMNEPKVSVIVASYNHADFIIDCLDSIVSQTYRNIELIIIDDGSTDDSVSRIDRFVKLHVNFNVKFIARENVGLCNTLNEGLMLANGEFVVPFASDDVMKNNRLAVQVDYLTKNAAAIGCFSGVILIDENNKKIGSYGNQPGRYRFDDIFLMTSSLPAPTAMIRSTKISDVGGYDPDVKIEDLYMWLKLTANGGTLDNIGGFLTYYRQHGKNFSHNREILCQEAKKVLDLYVGHGLYPRAVSSLMLSEAIIYAKNHTKPIFRPLLSAVTNCPKILLGWRFYRSLGIVFFMVFRRYLLRLHPAFKCLRS